MLANHKTLLKILGIKVRSPFLFWFYRKRSFWISAIAVPNSIFIKSDHFELAC